MLNIFLNFDFYGSGNIGDDLSLDGFMKVMKDEDFRFMCAVPRDFSCLQKRFPGIDFFGREFRNDIAKQCDVWIGAGDTPIQVKSGDWFLQKLERDYEIRKTSGKRYYFSGIGAEREAEIETARYKKILEKVDHIWTRDAESAEFLENIIGISASRISRSSDLANISLGKIFSNGTGSLGRKKYDAGICYYDESMNEENVQVLKSFSELLTSEKKKCLFFINDVNENSAGGKRSSGRIASWIEKFLGRKREVYVPDYQTETIGDLVSHYREIDIVLSSRYHVLLAASWAGCKVAALERSSKISALCRELSIPEIKGPLSIAKLSDSLYTATSVSKMKLIELRDRATKSLDELKGELRKEIALQIR